MPKPGQIVQGDQRKWILAKQLRRGGQGSVWTAYDYSLYEEKDRNLSILEVPLGEKELLEYCRSELGEPGFAVKFLDVESLDQSKRDQALGRFKQDKIVAGGR